MGTRGGKLGLTREEKREVETRDRLGLAIKAFEKRKHNKGEGR